MEKSLNRGLGILRRNQWSFSSTDNLAGDRVLPWTYRYRSVVLQGVPCPPTGSWGGPLPSRVQTALEKRNV